MSASNTDDLTNLVNNNITTNTIRDITALKTRTVLKAIIDSLDPSRLITGILDVGDSNEYNANTKQLTISTANRYIGIFTINAAAWTNAITYAQYNLVRSTGGDGGVAGRCYRSKQLNNLNHLLSDAAWWEFADSSGGNIGNVEIIKINGFSTTHDIQFEAGNGISITFIATPQYTIAAGQIALDLNTNVTVEGLGYLVLQSKSTYLRKVAGGLLV